MPTGHLPRSFFAHPTLEVARALLGTLLVRELPGGRRLSGWVVETEAYIGTEDQACHARHGRTPRNAPMWGPAGRSYVYFTYGMHWLLNAVTEHDGFPAAVLLRGLVPNEGLHEMRRRRNGRPDDELTDGPAKLCQSLAIDGELDDVDLCASDTLLWFQQGVSVPSDLVTRGPRVGLNTVPEPWLSKPWRFQVDHNKMDKLIRSKGES